MPSEFELPCTDCGGTLEERSVEGAEVPFTDVSGSVAVAQCSECGSRYYPETTLERL